jgi:hypothetical protein
VDDITKSETWMATKHDTRLEQRAEFSLQGH